VCDDSKEDYHGSGGGFFWFYMASHSNHPVPAVGSHYTPSNGTYNGRSLHGNVARGGLPKSGGGSVKSFTKSGGFGGRGFGSSS